MFLRSSLVGALIYVVALLVVPSLVDSIVGTPWPGVALLVVGLLSIVYLDARRHGLDAPVWALVVAVIPLAGIAIYVSVRSAPAGFLTWRSWLARQQSRSHELRPWSARRRAD